MIGLFYGLASIFIVLGWNFGGFAFLYWVQKKESTSFKKLGYLSLACLAIAWLALFVLYLSIQYLHLKTFWISTVAILSSLLFIVSGIEWWGMAKIVQKKRAEPMQEKRALAAFLIFTTSVIILIAMQFFIRFP